MKLPQWLMPTTLGFGPVFIVIGLQGTSLTSTYYSYAGALMVSFGLLSLWRQVIDLEKDIREQRTRVLEEERPC